MFEKAVQRPSETRKKEEVRGGGFNDGFDQEVMGLNRKEWEGSRFNLSMDKASFQYRRNQSNNPPPSAYGSIRSFLVALFSSMVEDQAAD